MSTHNHESSSSHNHNHATPQSLSTAFIISIGLNVAFVIVELYYGFLSNSVALIADATHNFGDVIGLILGFVAFKLASRFPSQNFTFGFKSSTILATLISNVLLLIATGSILWEATQKLIHPSAVEGQTVIIIATIGVFINGISAYLLSKGNKDLNVNSAFLHLLSDALVSVGVVVAGVIIITTGFVYADAIVSLLIGLIILRSTIKVMFEAVSLSLQGVPKGIDITKVRQYLKSIEGVDEVHDLHIWAMSTSENALTCHLVASDESVKIDLIDICHELEHDFDIIHPTIQVESHAQKEACKLKPDHIV